MGLTFAVLFFFGLLLIWVVLPFLPALHEIRRKTDAKPLPIVHDSEVDVRYPARRFRAFVKTPLAPILDRCRLEGRNESGALEDGTAFLVLAKAGDLAAVAGAQSREGCRQVVFSTRALELPPKSSFLLELYGEDSVRTGSDSVYRAILAEESIRLGERCTTLRWIHAGGSVQTAPGCRLLGRASADGAMRLASGCRFERLHAPRIEFGSPLPPDPPFGDGKSLQPHQVPNVVEAKAGRWLIKGSLHLGARKVVSANLVATGRMEIGEGTRIEGSIKSHQDIVLSRGVVVTGSVVSGRSIKIGEGCRIHGPILAEEAITIAARCLLGSPDSQTTVNAKTISITPGVVCHGTVWAHEDGVLSGPDRDTPFVEVPRSSGMAQADLMPHAVDAPELPLAAPAIEPETPVSVVEPQAAAFALEPETAAPDVEPEPATLALQPETAAPDVEPEPAALDLDAEVEFEVVAEPPPSIRRQALPQGVILPSGPLTVVPTSFTSTRQRPVDLSGLRPLVGDSQGPVDPRALPVPKAQPEDVGLLTIVPRRNGDRGSVSTDPSKIGTMPEGLVTGPGPVRRSPLSFRPEDRDEG